MQNDLSQKVQQCEKAALTALEEYKNSLLNDFLAAANELRKILTTLLEKGTVPTEYICLEGNESSLQFCMAVFTKSNVEYALKQLESLNTKTVIDVYRNLYFLYCHDPNLTNKLDYPVTNDYGVYPEFMFGGGLITLPTFQKMDLSYKYLSKCMDALRALNSSC